MEHLIPDSLVAGLPQWALLLLTAVGVTVLIRGADWLVDGASGVAYRFGISKVIVGATVVSLGTTSPEAAVSVMAAWSGEPGLALGNAIGSIIADTGLIFGLGAMLTVLPADRYVLKRQGWVQFASAALLSLICYGSWAALGPDAALGRWVGVLFLLLLVAYLYVSVKWSRAHPHGEPFQMHEQGDVQQSSQRSVLRLVALAVTGLVLVLLASRLLIVSVIELAEHHWHVPHVVIAATLVAFGTSLPELVIGLTSIFKGHKEILVGNVIGADILNVLFVVGASAVAAPLPMIEHEARVPAILFWIHLPTMLLILILFRLFIVKASRNGEFRRWHGVPLVALYVIYAVVQYLVS